jgi:hypothetical protein
MRGRWKRIAWIVAGVVAVVIVAGVVVIGPRNVIGILRYDTRREGDFRAGDRAPDVELLDLEGAHVHLRDRLGDRPTVIIFGSFT